MNPHQSSAARYPGSVSTNTNIILCLSVQESVNKSMSWTSWLFFSHSPHTLTSILPSSMFSVLSATHKHTHSIIVHGDFSLASNCFQLSFLYFLSLNFNLTLSEIFLDFKINVLKLKLPCKSSNDVKAMSCKR